MRGKIDICSYHSPCGELILGSYGERLCLCRWKEGKHAQFVDARLQRGLLADYVPGSSPVLVETISQLDAYFAKENTGFDIPLLLVGTDFQKIVWNGLGQIPYGTTESYGAFAERLGMPYAVRAVAAANGVNPVSVIIPCHRVVGKNGTLVGYEGGLAAKGFLLELESCIMPLFTTEMHEKREISLRRHRNE